MQYKYKHYSVKGIIFLPLLFCSLQVILNPQTTPYHIWSAKTMCSEMSNTEIPQGLTLTDTHTVLDKITQLMERTHYHKQHASAHRQAKTLYNILVCLHV